MSNKDQKKIKALVSISYKKDSLDKDMVNVIAKHLTKRDVKRYIRELKNVENGKNVVMFLPVLDNTKSIFGKLFPKKTIIYKKDPSLLLGSRIIDNDILYEFDLKDTLDNMISYIQSYD